MSEIQSQQQIVAAAYREFMRLQDEADRARGVWFAEKQALETLEAERRRYAGSEVWPQI